MFVYSGATVTNFRRTGNECKGLFFLRQGMSSRAIVNLFVGEDEMPLQAAARELVNTLVPQSGQAFGLEIVQTKSESSEEAALALRSCVDALRTPALFAAAGKVVWLRDAKFLGNTVVMKDETVRERGRQLVETLGAVAGMKNVLVITCPDVDRRSALFRFAGEHGTVREFNIPDKAHLLEQHAAERAEVEFRARGLRAGRDIMKEFCGRVGSDSREIASEAEKLSLYLGERREVSLADIEAVVSATAVSAMWDLLDAVGQREFVEAQGVLRDLLANGESPIGITAALAARLRELILYREALDQGWAVASSGYSGRNSTVWKNVPDSVGEVLGMSSKRDPRTVHPFFASRMAGQAKNYTLAQLVCNQRCVVEAHEALVSSPVSPQAVLELLLVRIAR